MYSRLLKIQSCCFILWTAVRPKARILLVPFLLGAITTYAKEKRGPSEGIAHSNLQPGRIIFGTGQIGQSALSSFTVSWSEFDLEYMVAHKVSLGLRVDSSYVSPFLTSLSNYVIFGPVASYFMPVIKAQDFELTPYFSVAVQPFKLQGNQDESAKLRAGILWHPLKQLLLGPYVQLRYPFNSNLKFDYSILYFRIHIAI